MDDLISRQALIDKIGLIQLHFVAHGDNKSLFDIINELPAADAVVLPCKVGDTLYSKDGKVAEVVEFHIDKHRVHMTVSFKCDYNCEHCAFNTWRQEYSGEYLCEGEWGEMTIPADELGKTVFRTREEAENALGERKEDNA